MHNLRTAALALKRGPGVSPMPHAIPYPGGEIFLQRHAAPRRRASPGTISHVRMRVCFTDRALLTRDENSQHREECKRAASVDFSEARLRSPGATALASILPCMEGLST